MNQENTVFMAWVEELKAQHPVHGEYIDCATEEARAKILTTLRTVKEVNDNYYMSMVRFVYRATGTKKEQEHIDIAVKSIQKFNSTGGTNEDPNKAFKPHPQSPDEFIKSLVMYYASPWPPSTQPVCPSDSDILVILKAFYDGRMRNKDIDQVFPAPMSIETGYLKQIYSLWVKYSKGQLRFETFKSRVLDMLLAP